LTQDVFRDLDDLAADDSFGDDAVAPIVPGMVSLTVASAPGWSAGGAMAA
jgi:hypothetical protein